MLFHRQYLLFRKQEHCPLKRNTEGEGNMLFRTHRGRTRGMPLLLSTSFIHLAQSITHTYLKQILSHTHTHLGGNSLNKPRIQSHKGLFCGNCVLPHPLQLALFCLFTFEKQKINPQSSHISHIGLFFCFFVCFLRKLGPAAPPPTPPHKTKNEQNK